MTTNYASCGKYINDAARIDQKVVIITGSNCGLGYATAVELARRGGKIYLACRSEEKTLPALKEIKELSKSETIYFMKLDLASLDSVREFSRKFHETENKLDILINNAGVLNSGSRTEDGFEVNMGVNHLGHFLLTNLLLDLLKASAPSRIVVVASKLHSIGTIEKDNFKGEKSFPGTWKGYGNSKLANILFTRELSKILEGTGVTINCLCPGPVDTNAPRNLNVVMRALMKPFVKLFYKSPHDGAQTQIMLAVEPALENVTGKYFVGCKEANTSDKAKDEEMAKWLWNHSENLTGLKVVQQQ